jgi:hypothetical protein
LSRNLSKSLRQPGKFSSIPLRIAAGTAALELEPRRLLFGGLNAEAAR